jgi:metal-sulfur cluster biosynthetic enzyme
MTGTPDRIIDALRTVYDPCCKEKGISVVDMGLVRDVAVDGDDATVRLILTTGWCPFATHLLSAITERVEALEGVGSARVDITWDQPWTTERLSDDARRKLRFLPDPVAVGDRDAFLESTEREGARQ